MKFVDNVKVGIPMLQQFPPNDLMSQNSFSLYLEVRNQHLTSEEVDSRHEEGDAAADDTEMFCGNSEILENNNLESRMEAKPQQTDKLRSAR
ncbi:Uncharacterized protein TCM_011073 [Theobroma cacao]|uniref:Uncharacterized protein n=1 Tax=Theobroma cacao TaxID=3641 RepID=A0A061E850_THECC|nr:Uncharacterized protein TCM_011073 [Theobroma cacao]